MDRIAKEPSKLWYLTPILLGAAGGILLFFFFRRQGHKKFATNLLTVGLICEVLRLVILWLIGSFVLPRIFLRKYLL